MVKAKVECEEAQRVLIVSMNGIAALYSIKKDINLAIKTYQVSKIFELEVFIGVC